MTMRYMMLLAALIAAMISGPGHARPKSGKATLPPKGRMVRASFYYAPTRASFASRHRDWRGKTFAITYQGRTVHAVCRDYGPQARTGRDIDVSRDVAQRLGFVRKGVANVHIRKVH